MASNSKVLTVSYGTFACTLKGFNDPVAEMRDIASFFVSLSADDPYFAAEPPTPLSLTSQQDTKFGADQDTSSGRVDNRPLPSQSDKNSKSELQPVGQVPLSANIRSAAHFPDSFFKDRETSTDHPPTGSTSGMADETNFRGVLDGKQTKPNSHNFESKSRDFPERNAASNQKPILPVKRNPTRHSPNVDTKNGAGDVFANAFEKVRYENLSSDVRRGVQASRETFSLVQTKTVELVDRRGSSHGYKSANASRDIKEDPGCSPPRLIVSNNTQATKSIANVDHKKKRCSLNHETEAVREQASTNVALKKMVMWPSLSALLAMLGYASWYTPVYAKSKVEEFQNGAITANELESVGTWFYFFPYLFLCFSLVFCFNFTKFRSKLVSLFSFAALVLLIFPRYFAALYELHSTSGTCIAGAVNSQEILQFSYRAFTSLGFGVLQPLNGCRSLAFFEVVSGYIYFGLLLGLLISVFRYASKPTTRYNP